MVSRKTTLLLAALLFGCRSLSAAQCVQTGGVYEGFLVSGVTVQTPLRFPVKWIENSLLGGVTTSLQNVAAGLPVKKGDIFHFSNHLFAMQQLSGQYSDLAEPGARMALAFVVPHFQCDPSGRTVAIAYHVYSTQALYFASRLLEASRVLPNRTLTIGKAAEANGKPMIVPYFGYNASRRGFGGAKLSWSRRNGFINSLELDGNGSPTSYLADIKIGGKLDPASGSISHAEWNIGFLADKRPTGTDSLRSSTGFAQGDFATRAKSSLGALFRFGGSFAFGTSSSVPVSPQILADAPERVLKLYAGTTFSHARHIWSASYGFQIGRGTSTTHVDYSKHLVDFSHQVRLLPREHWPIQFDTHFNAGWITGSDNEIPAVERFFGGNRPGNFSNNDLWQIPSGPLLRSVPENQLNQNSGLAQVGGRNFVALNVTAAFPVWSYPAMPPIVRYAKPLQDGIHLGLMEAERESSKDYRARTSLFADVLRRADTVVPNLNALRQRLSHLEKNGNITDDLKADFQDLIDTYIDPAVDSISNAHKHASSGLAWSALRRLSGGDPDSNPLAHISDDLTNSVVPALKELHCETDANLLQLSADQVDLDRRDLDSLLLKIEPNVVVPSPALNAFDEDLRSLNKSAKALLILTTPFQGRQAPVGPVAFEAAEWAKSLATATNPEDLPTDQFDYLYALTRLALGIGKLVPPQIESVASAAESLAKAIDVSDPMPSKEIGRNVAQLRDGLTRVAAKVKEINIPPGERWARQQNSYFVRAMDVAFREMNLAAISPVVMFDAARLSPQPAGFPKIRYGIGPGLRFSIVSFQVTIGYSINPSPQINEGHGALAFSMDIVDLFR